MIRTFLLIACLLTSVACRQRGGTPADANIVANAGNHSAETIRPDTVARPPLAFGHETWDFGTIPETGGPVVHVFRFTNSGTKPVVVERVGVTCGCMKPTFSQAPVLPGGSGEIGIAYDPADRPGAFDKAVYVYTDGSRMMPLRIRGSVAARPETAADRFPVEFGGGIRLSVKEVNFRMVEQRHDRRLTLRCLNTSPYEVRLRAEFAEPLPFLRAEAPAVLAPGAEGEIAFICDLSAAEVWGTFVDSCYLTVSGRRLEGAVVVRGTGIGDLAELREMPRGKRPQAEIAESLLDFGTCAADGTAECRFTLENKGGSPLRIYAVKYPEGVTGQIAAGEEIAAGRAKTFVLRVDGRTAGSGNYFVHVELLVSDALSPLCALRVRGRFA